MLSNVAVPLAYIISTRLAGPWRWLRVSDVSTPFLAMLSSVSCQCAQSQLLLVPAGYLHNNHDVDIHCCVALECHSCQVESTVQQLSMPPTMHCLMLHKTHYTKSFALHIVAIQAWRSITKQFSHAPWQSCSASAFKGSLDCIKRALTLEGKPMAHFVVDRAFLLAMLCVVS